jgi:hypothetical protein
LVEKYKQSVADNSKVAMIHVSRDRDDESAEKWAAQEGFPWLTVLPDDVDRSGLMEYRKGNAVPSYFMVDKDGNMVAEGAAACFNKAAEVAAEQEA